jgi:SAM-dependent methyltransferase
VATKTPAQVYEEFFVPAMFEPCAELLLELVPPQVGERVLDVACGSGVVARKAAERVRASGFVVGLDLRPGMLAVATSLPAPAGASIEWREGDALELDFADGSFDVGFCHHGLQFFADQERALREMRRVLRKEGRLGVAVWQGLERFELFNAMTEVELRHLGALGMAYEDLAQPFLFGDPEWLRGLLAGAAYVNVRIESRSFVGRFPFAGSFVQNLEFAYSAVIPEFAEDPDAFRKFVAAVERETKDLVERHRNGDEIVFPLHVNLATAQA